MQFHLDQQLDEMCMDFLFYYPAQYRNADSNGNPQLFAFCGNMIENNNILTLCGGLSQANTAFIISSGQVNRNDGGYNDPSNFTISNKGNGGESKTSNVCTIPTTTTSTTTTAAPVVPLAKTDASSNITPNMLSIVVAFIASSCTIE